MDGLSEGSFSLRCGDRVTGEVGCEVSGCSTGQVCGTLGQGACPDLPGHIRRWQPGGPSLPCAPIFHVARGEGPLLHPPCTACLWSLPHVPSLRGTHSQEPISRPLGTTGFFHPLTLCSLLAFQESSSTSGYSSRAT